MENELPRASPWYPSSASSFPPASSTAEAVVFAAGNKSPNESGLTLIEIMIVMVLFTLIGAFAAITTLNDYRNFSFRGDKDMVINALHKARSQAINNICLSSSTPTTCPDGTSHGVHFQPGHYIIFQGNNDTSVDQTIQTSNGVQVATNLAFTQTDFSVVFNQLDGSTGADTTIYIKDSAGHSSQISINNEGRIDW
jgi:prepilin-type N-terminal cleavage/methylation domain-containing protein